MLPSRSSIMEPRDRFETGELDLIRGVFAGFVENTEVVGRQPAGEIQVR